MSRTFIVIILLIFVLVGAAFLFTLRWGSELHPISLDNGNANIKPGPPAPPPPPSVTFTVQLQKKGNTLWIEWQNLPADTGALLIYRSAKGKEDWSLWKTIKVEGTPNGNAQFNIGNSTFANYSFYAQATGGGGGNGTNNGTSTANNTILWTSSSTTPGVTTSTLNVPPSSGTPSSTASSTPPSSTSTTSTVVTTPPAPTSTSGTSTPQGTPYYTPQLTISGYGSGQTGSFWAQHVDDKIQVGWQNLPQQTTRIEISRSQSENGPWTLILAQENPTVSSYSIQLLDDTVGHAYYYKMIARSGATIVGNYGPVYLPPVGQ